MIVTVTLNPAIDRVFLVDELKINSNNRIKESLKCIGGKGTHVSINLALLGVKSRAIGIAMGENGTEIIETLKKMDIDVNFLYFKTGNSRTNYVIVDKYANSTLITEKGQKLSPSQVEEFIEHFKKMVLKDDLVVISGDVSNQGSSKLLDILLEHANTNNVRICLDVGGEQLSSSIHRKPYLIKPNLDELSELYQREFSGIDEVIEAAIDLNKKGIENVVISCGSNGFVSNIGGDLYHVIPPNVKAVNTVGCGDALLAGVLAGLEKKLEPEDALRYACAVSASAALNIETAGFDIEVAKKLMQDVVINKYM